MIAQLCSQSVSTILVVMIVVVIARKLVSISKRKPVPDRKENTRERERKILRRRHTEKE